MLHDSNNLPDSLPTTGGTKPPNNPIEDPPPVPGYKNIRVYCDESGIHGARFVGFGSLWMPHERRGDFQALVDEQRRIHRYDRELKWSRVSALNEACAAGVITEFFKRPWLMFHSLIVRVAYVDMDHHDSRDQWLRKHFAILLTNKIAYFADGKRKAFHVIVDPLPSSYKKAGEAAHTIIGHTLRRDVGENVLIKSLTERDSKLTAGIQVADLLLGGALAAWQGDVTAEPKKRISRLIAMHLGWPDTHADTYPHESKFNLWYFYDPKTHEPREVHTRKVNLHFPVVPFRKTRR
jgi:hypothetical protein